MPMELVRSGGASGSASGENAAADSNVLRLDFAREALRSSVSKATRSAEDQVALSPSEVRHLLGICLELIDLCSKVTGKIDPAVGAMISYARDEAMDQVFEISS